MTSAGSHFLGNAESDYAPVEEEALAVAWYLEQIKVLIMWCYDLFVSTEHKPQVKILGNSRLYEVEIPILFD